MENVRRIFELEAWKFGSYIHERERSCNKNEKYDETLLVKWFGILDNDKDLIQKELKN